MIDNRGLFIKEIIEKKKYNKYLELGLSLNPRAPYRLIEDIGAKHSVDMNPDTGADFVVDTNTFFSTIKDKPFCYGLEKDYKWDVIFIDGDHFAEQVYLDLCNSFNHLDDNGVIFMHDSLPWSYDMTIESRVASRQATCQDAWKVIEYCLKERPDMHVCTIEENGGGIGVIKKAKDKRPMLPREYNRFYQYGVYEREKFKFMNSIKKEELLSWLEDPTYNF